MKVYVSAHSIVVAQAAAATLEALGHTVTSRWLKEAPIPGFTTNLPADQKPARALFNFEDIDKADAYVGIVADGLVPGGKFVEQGYALGKGKKCFLLGEKPENLSSYHPGFVLVDDLSKVS